MIIVDATMPVMRPIDVDSPAKVVKVAVPDASMKASAPTPASHAMASRESFHHDRRRGRGGAATRREGRVPTAVTTTLPRRSPTPQC